MRRTKREPHSERDAAQNRELLEKQIVGGLPLGRFYPGLKDCMLLCATEMNRRQDMDIVAGAFERL